MCCKVPRCWLWDFDLIVGSLEEFFGCGCILLMCTSCRVGVGVKTIRVWDCIRSCLGVGEDWVHIFVSLREKKIGGCQP